VSLDPPPSTGKVGIGARQGQYGMEMIRKDYDCLDRERALATCHAKGISQSGDMIDKDARTTVGERDRKKERPSSKKISSISNHSGIGSRVSLRSRGLR
jgi:hypothetical protein